VPVARRSQKRRRVQAPRKPSLPDDVPYPAALRALRGQPAEESELLLCRAAADWDPTFRAAAVSSLGWWEPVHRKEVIACLNVARRDPNNEVRQAARGALARLGERQALQWFRQALTAENSQHLHEALQLVANEGLTLLWPDLDRLADAEDPDVAHHAAEALERLSESMERK
jgi:HEAT repeat protein